MECVEFNCTVIECGHRFGRMDFYHTVSILANENNQVAYNNAWRGSVLC